MLGVVLKAEDGSCQLSKVRPAEMVDIYRHLKNFQVARCLPFDFSSWDDYQKQYDPQGEIASDPSQIHWQIANSSRLAVGQIGIINIQTDKENNNSGRIYCTILSSYQRRGMASTAMKLAIGHAFNPAHLNLSNLWVEIPEDNLEGQKLLKRLEFELYPREKLKIIRAVLKRP